MIVICPKKSMLPMDSAVIQCATNICSPPVSPTYIDGRPRWHMLTSSPHRNATVAQILLRCPDRGFSEVIDILRAGRSGIGRVEQIGRVLPVAAAAKRKHRYGHGARDPPHKVEIVSL